MARNCSPEKWAFASTEWKRGSALAQMISLVPGQLQLQPDHAGVWDPLGGLSDGETVFADVQREGLVGHIPDVLLHVRSEREARVGATVIGVE